MLSLLLLLLATPARAQDGGNVDQAFDSDAGEPDVPAHTLLNAALYEELEAPASKPPTPPEPPAYDTYWQLGTGLNIGLIDVVFRTDHLWGEASTVLGVPIASYQNPVFGGVVAVGYSVDLGFNGAGRWYFELFLEAVAGRVLRGGASGLLAGAGWGFGFRYSLPSGWELQFRLPCFGMVAEDYNTFHTFNAGESILDFFEANTFGWSFFTIGKRF
jgi:hypothetical protein